MLLLLETKPILNVINYQVKVHWLFIFPHRNPSIWAHLALSIERIKYGFEDHHPAGQHQVPEKRGKYWSTTIFGSTLPMIYLVWSREHCITFGSVQHRIQVNLFHHFIVVILPCVIIIHHEARMLVLTWVLNSTTVAVIQLFLLDEFVNQSRISQLEYMSNKTGYPLTLDNVPKNIVES